MNYLGLVLVFISALVAIRGATWDEKAYRWRKITITGWVTAGLILVGFVVSCVQMHTSAKEYELQFQELNRTRSSSEQANNEIVKLEGQLATYQNVISEIRQHVERQLQMTMAQYVTLRGGEIWRAPNEIFPGSIVEFYLWKGSIELRYGDRTEIIRSSYDNPVRMPIIGNPGQGMEWTIRCVSEFHDEGKIYVFSSPRSRSNDWSWLEEKINALP